MVSFENVQEIDDAIKDVRSDASDTNWMVVGYPDTGVDKFVFKGSGSGGIEEMKQVFTQTSCYYGLLRVTEVIDSSETVKFVFIKYLGDSMKPMWKAKITTHHGSVWSKLKPFHVELFAESKDEATEDVVMKLVGDASMSKSKVLHEKSAQAVTSLRPKQANKVVEQSLSGNLDSLHLTTPTISKTKSGTSPSSSRHSSSTSSSSPGVRHVKFENEDAIREGIQDVRSDHTETNWVLSGYVDEAKTTIAYIAKGTGDIEELKGYLEDNNIYYGMIRATDIIDNSETVKFCFIHYMGCNVKPMARAKTSTHKGTVTDLFNPFHVEIFGSDKSDLAHEHVMKLVQNASFSASHVLDGSAPPPKPKSPRPQYGTPASNSSPPQSSSPAPGSSSTKAASVTPCLTEQQKEEMNKLVELRDQGILSSEEFDKLKERIVGASPPTSQMAESSAPPVTAHQTSQPPAQQQTRAPPKVSTSSSGKAKLPTIAPTAPGLEWDNYEEICNYIQDVRNDATDTNWCLFGYVQGSKSKIGIVGKGNGGVEEVRQCFDDAQVFYGLVRVVEVIDESTTVKFCFVHWLGDRASPMLKARVSTHKGAVEKLLHPYHVTLFATSLDEVSQEIVHLLVAKASMSHSNVLNK